MFQRRQKAQIPTQPTKYPIGTFLETEIGYFYIAGPDKRYRLTKRTLDSWNPHRVVPSSEAAVKSYRVAAKMKFRNGSLIHNLGDGKIYLIENGKRRHMVSPEAFERIGAEPNTKHVTSVSLAEIKLHELGEELS